MDINYVKKENDKKKAKKLANSPNSATHSQNWVNLVRKSIIQYDL